MDRNLYTIDTETNNLKQYVEKYGTVVEVDFINHQINNQGQGNKHVDSDEVRRLKRKEYKLKKRASLSEEQRMKINEYQRNWHAKLTEEQRLKRNECDRKKRANLTEEQRLKNSEYLRKRRANLTEEQRMRINEYKCKRRANLTEEKRIKEREYNRNRYANLTEEQRMKISEYDRKRRESLTEEQRLKRNEYRAKRRANLMKEKRLNKSQNARNDNKNTPRSTLTDKKATTITEEQRLETENPLQKLIEQMRYVHKISQIDNNLLKSILQMFGLNYPQNILIQSHSALQKLNDEIDSIFLIKLLENWEGWITNNRMAYLSSTKSYDDLFCYLCNNFLYIRLHKDISLIHEVNSFCPPENYIDTTCSLKQLKSLFYHSPHNHTYFYREDNVTFDSSSHSREPFSISMPNLPYISTQISLPNFSMSHLNLHIDKYHLLDITREMKYKYNSQNAPELFLEMNNVKTEPEICLEFVAKFLSQLKAVLENSNEKNIIHNRKIEIITAIIELQKDISHCTDKIQTNTKYTINLARNPYTRYLGHSDDGDMKISIAEQKLLSETISNVRLREIRYPRISFILEKFTVPYKVGNDGIDFTFNKSFLTKLNNCISYKCVLCNEDLGSYAPSQKISDHLMQYHGLEPDWECVKCSESFSDNFLIKHRWAHNCQ